MSKWIKFNRDRNIADEHAYLPQVVAKEGDIIEVSDYVANRVLNIHKPPSGEEVEAPNATEDSTASENQESPILSSSAIGTPQSSGAKTSKRKGRRSSK
jgi:hypothetical protein